MPHLQLEQLVRTYGSVRAVDGLSLEVASGEHVVVVGPSGGGKTSLLRMIAGLDDPDGGRVRLDGRDVTPEPPERRGLGMVFQTPALLPHRDVAGNLALPLELQRVPASERPGRIRAMAEQLGLAGLLTSRPAELSGGEAQRVALGRALIGGARLLLLDEPFSGLDAPLRRKLSALLRELRLRHGLTLLHVTHDQQEALAAGDRVVLIDRGRVVQAAPPGVIYRQPATGFAAAFFGDPPMNWLDGRIISDRGQARFEPATDLPAWPLPGRAPAAGNIRLAIRPEAVAWGAVTAPGPVSWPATVQRVEFWGATSWAVLDVAGACWWARWPGPGTVRVGDAVQLRPDPATAHWFDAVSDLRIEPD